MLGRLPAGRRIGPERVNDKVTCWQTLQRQLPSRQQRSRLSALRDRLLTAHPASNLAVDSVRNSIRPAAHAYAPAGTKVLVGGETAVDVDTSEALFRDYQVVFPIAALLIALVLALLLCQRVRCT